jgi:iron complex outermembrane receptor protein
MKAHRLTPLFAAPMPDAAPARSVVFSLAAAVGAAMGWSAVAAAQSPPIADIVVTARRVASDTFEIPASVDRVDRDAITAGRQQVNLSESVGGVPGLVARDRQNYAQDVQVSVRGFGARSTFGIRGVRVYVDGIPATLPDGQGQLTNIDLNSTDRIEVLRGPFSALYGNSSGGVIQVFTETGAGPPTLTFGATAGSYGLQKPAIKIDGGTDAFGYVASYSEFETDGYRDHSAAERDIGNLKLDWTLGQADKLSFVVNTLDLPKAQDPLGLTRAQFDTNPRGVDPSAIQFNTRKTVDQTQEGLTWQHSFDDRNSLQAMIYSGTRGAVQYQSIPVAAQANPQHPGGVIDLARDYDGLDVHWTSNFDMLARPLTLVAGLTYDNLDEVRKGYQNFVGTTLGVQGALRRNEDNNADTHDAYLQASWHLAPKVTLDAGVRSVDFAFVSRDHYIVGANGNDSGETNFSATLPALGVLYSATDRVHLYLSAGRGFETPTLNELAYRPDGKPGLNLALQAAESDNYELGAKLRLSTQSQLTAAIFETDTTNEIVTQTNVGGRSTYQNASATRRRGTEISWATASGSDWHAQVAYTWLDAVYQDGFLTCTATPCAAPNVPIAAGNKIPGIPDQILYGLFSWTHFQHWRADAEARYLTKVFVNDLNSDSAASYSIASLAGSYVTKVGSWQLTAFARVDNLFDKQYAGSVIVNEGNGRFFEPAPGRTYAAGLTAAFGFK